MSPLRLRLRFTKTGRVRFIGHLDLVRVWERAVRRAKLPLEFTAGYSPRPRMHFGLALPTGFASTAEYLDVDLSDHVDADETAVALSSVLPEGIDVVAAAAVAADSQSLQAVVAASDYVVASDDDPSAAAERLAAVLEAGSIEYELERKGRTTTVDLRPGILDLAVAPTREVRLDMGSGAPTVVSGRCIVRMRLAAQPRSYRPTEVCAVTEPPLAAVLVHRCAQLVGGPVEFSEPLPVGSSAGGPAHQPEPIERSGNGSLREEATPDPSTTALAPRI